MEVSYRELPTVNKHQKRTARAAVTTDDFGTRLGLIAAS